MRALGAGLGLLVIVWLTPGVWGQPAQNQPQTEPPSSETQHQPAERGRYLVMHVAMCVQCHTPRFADGSLNPRRLLQGAPLPVKSPFPQQQWAFTAPRIAGLPGGWSERDLVTLLTTGRRPDGTAPLPPMPSYRMHEEDAAAVAQFLASLRE